MQMPNCLNPKNYTKYAGNGTGRDFYVIFSNGGLTREKLPFQDGLYEKGSILKKASFRESLPNIVPKFQHYPNDGTGRDFYITCNEGGQLASPRKNNYIKGLRSYDQQLNDPLPNDYLRRTPYTSDRKKLKSRLLSLQQRQLTYKLSSPKNIQ